LDIASLSYASDSQDRLPTVDAPRTGNFGPWTLVGPTATDFLKRYCPSRDALYDPGNPGHNRDDFWNFSTTPINGTNYPSRIIGYAVTYTLASALKPTNINYRSVPEGYQPTNFNVIFPVPNASERVLVSGAVISEREQDQTNGSSRASYNYSNVPLYGRIFLDTFFVIDENGDVHPAAQGGQLIYVRSSHLKGKMPTGDNLGMLDGSARWRRFKDMVPRTIPLPSSVACTFWW
jgi:hypothetical protein